MHLLDTDIFTHLQQGNARVTARYHAAFAEEVCTTIITKAEMLRGRLDYLLKADSADEFLLAQELLRQTEFRLAGLQIVEMGQASLAHFEQLRQSKGLKKIGRADLLIASIALANRATLVTRNVRDFRRIPNLQVVNWLD
jgi:tRNA(fMet)-specific endonuclease VapC